MLPDDLAGDPAAVAINERLPEAILEVKAEPDGSVFYVSPGQILAVATYLKESADFEQLAAVTAVDWWPRVPRFEVVYFLHSYRNNRRMRLVLRSGENEEIDSLCQIWRGANWYEREVFDLFGIRFRNHPNLERIMMPADWEGYPLRRDYPIHGHKYSYQDE